MQTLLATTDSRELSGWQQLMMVEEEEAQHEKDIRESGDGKVYVHGAPPADDLTPGDEDGILSDDGETE